MHAKQECLVKIMELTKINAALKAEINDWERWYMYVRMGTCEVKASEVSVATGEANRGNGITTTMDSDDVQQQRDEQQPHHSDVQRTHLSDVLQQHDEQQPHLHCDQQQHSDEQQLSGHLQPHHSDDVQRQRDEQQPHHSDVQQTHSDDLQQQEPATRSWMDYVDECILVLTQRVVALKRSPTVVGDCGRTEERALRMKAVLNALRSVRDKVQKAGGSTVSKEVIEQMLVEEVPMIKSFLAGEDVGDEPT